MKVSPTEDYNLAPQLYSGSFLYPSIFKVCESGVPFPYM